MDYLFPLANRRSIADGTMEFTFDTTGAEYSFQPGQHVDLTLIDPPYTDGEGNVRTFSFVEHNPAAHQLKFATRMRDTAFKNSLKEVKVGTKVKFGRPMGRFILHQDSSKPAVFIAGGIGITPIISIISDATARRLPHEIYLFYSNRSLASTAYFNELEILAKQNSHFHFIPTLTDETPAGWQYEKGKISEYMLTNHTPNLQEAIAYIAGPAVMVPDMIALTQKAKVSPDNLRTEEFAGY